MLWGSERWPQVGMSKCRAECGHTGCSSLQFLEQRLLGSSYPFKKCLFVIYSCLLERQSKREKMRETEQKRENERSFLLEGSIRNLTEAEIRVKLHSSVGCGCPKQQLHQLCQNAHPREFLFRDGLACSFLISDTWINLEFLPCQGCPPGCFLTILWYFKILLCFLVRKWKCALWEADG